MPDAAPLRDLQRNVRITGNGNKGMRDGIRMLADDSSRCIRIREWSINDARADEGADALLC